MGVDVDAMRKGGKDESDPAVGESAGDASESTVERGKQLREQKNGKQLRNCCNSSKLPPDRTTVPLAHAFPLSTSLSLPSRKDIPIARLFSSPDADVASLSASFIIH